MPEREKDVLVLVTTTDTPPYSYRDEETGEIVGLEIDIARAAAKSLGCTLEVRKAKFPELLPMVSSGEADLAASGITITDGRRQAVDFSVPYATEGGMFLYRAADPMPTMIKAEMLRVGTMDASTYDYYLTSHGIDPIRYDSYVNALVDLREKRLDEQFELSHPLLPNSLRGEMIKYVGVWMPEGGFVQVGGGEKSVRNLARSALTGLTHGWHVSGDEGGIFITTDNGSGGRDADVQRFARDFPSTQDGVASASAFLDEVVEKDDPLALLSAKMHIILDEIASNIVKHSGATNFTFEVDCGRDSVKMTFADNGAEYDPITHADPDVSLPAEERPIGGLGILMVKKMASRMSYRREGGRNILGIELNLVRLGGV